MILEALAGQVAQRFDYEKRASVCLWFDPNAEFYPLTTALRAWLPRQAAPPFALIAYDAGASRGQLWIKRKVQQIRAADAEARVLVYLPLAEDAELDLLAEHRLAGITWRIDGKQPSLHRFLRAAGVPMTADPTEQRRLREGGGASLLTKYTARFAEQPRHFWRSGTLTPDLARERLLGDVDQRILDLACDPEDGWRAVRSDGVEAEFRDAVAARHGHASTSAADEWLRGLAEQLALVEAHTAHGEPSDFPLIDRLPAPGLRDHNLQLLHRWLRDRDARASWDRLIRQVEQQVDLAAWARGRPGLSFAFPHLVAARWSAAAGALEAAAPRQSATDAFFAERAEQIVSEAAHARTSGRPPGAWELLDDLRGLAIAATKARAAVAQAADVEQLVEIYVRSAGIVDAPHLRVRAAAERAELPAAALVADRAYAAYANALNDRFFERIAASGSLELPGAPYVTDRLDEAIWQGRGRRAVVIIDALRFDCAVELSAALGDGVDVEAVRAPLPTITPVGMTALLPRGVGEVTLEIAGSSLRPRIAGRNMADRANRLRVLADFGADCRDIEALEGVPRKPADLGELLVVFGHDDVDQLGHSDGTALVRHVEAEVVRLARLVERLHRWGYPEVHVVTDHGFILLDEHHIPEEVAFDRAWCQVLKQRFAIVPAAAHLPLTTFELPWDSELRVAVPPGLSFFKGESAFSHGGASLQELVIPHLVSRSQSAQRPVGVEVRVTSAPLVQTVVRVVLMARSDADQLSFAASGARRLVLDVLRDGASVLADGAKEVSLDAAGEELRVALFFASAEAFAAGETLTLDVRDADTSERFPPDGVPLSVGRDM